MTRPGLTGARGRYWVMATPLLDTKPYAPRRASNIAPIKLRPGAVIVCSIGGNK